MQAKVQIDTDRAEQIDTVLEKSLESNERIGYEIEASSDSIDIQVKTESLGQLRGCTDTVFRLTTLSQKILER